MAVGSYMQTSFLGGEWSSFSQGRIDLPQHKTAMNVCFNSLPTEEGVMVRRPGTEWAGYSRTGLSGKVHTINFGGQAPLKIELTANNLRVRLGKERCHGPGATISSISSATPAVMTLSGVLPGTFKSGSSIVLLPQNAATKQSLAYTFRRVFTIQTISHGVFALYDEFTGLPVNGAYLNWSSASSALASSTIDLPVPYTANTNWDLVRFIQAEMQVLILHPSYKPQILNISQGSGSLKNNNLVATTSNLSYSISPVTFIDGPYLNPSNTPELVAVSGAGDQGPIVMTVSSILDLNNGQGFLSTDVGRLIRMNSEPPLWSPLSNYGNPPNVGQGGGGGYPISPEGVFQAPFVGASDQGTIAIPLGLNGPYVVEYNDLYYAATGFTPGTSSASLPTGILYGQENIGLNPASNPIAWAATLAYNTWTWGKITQVVSSTEVVVTIYGPPILYPGLPMTYAMGAFSNTTGWPAAGCYAQGRFWLTGSIPNRFDASVSNNLFTSSSVLPLDNTQICYAPTDNGGNVQLQGVVLDSSAISETLNSAGINEIQWLKENAQGVIIGTAGGEYLAQASNNNNVITPTSIVVNNTTKYQCADAEPTRTGLTTVFIQLYQRRLIELLTDVFSGKLYGPNLNEYSRHISYPGIAEIASQEEKTPVTWSRLASPGVVIDGNTSWLAGTTYRRVSLFSTQPPEFNGWHRHSLGSGFPINSLTTGPSNNGLTEALTLLTQGPGSNGHMVEVMTPFPDEDAPLTDAWFLDCASTPAAAMTSATGGATNGITLLGLNYFFDLASLSSTLPQVTVFLGGLNCGSYTPNAAGQIFVPWGSDPDGQLSYAYLSNMSQSGIPFANGTMGIDNGALNVPCVVGYPYISQGQLIRPMEPIPGLNGPTLGKTRRTHMFGVLLQNCIYGSIQFGSDFASTLMPALFQQPNGLAYNHTTLYEGVYWNTINADYNFENGLAWQISGPYPGTVCAFEGFYRVEDR